MLITNSKKNVRREANLPLKQFVKRYTYDMVHYLCLGYQFPNLAKLNGHYQIYKMILSFCWSHTKQWLVLIDQSAYVHILGVILYVFCVWGLLSYVLISLCLLSIPSLLFPLCSLLCIFPFLPSCLSPPVCQYCFLHAFSSVSCPHHLTCPPPSSHLTCSSSHH